MDGKNILEICNADRKMQKAMHKDEVIWEPNRRIPATVFYQEIESSGAPSITKESVVKCLESSKFKIAYMNGFERSNDLYSFIYGHGKKQFGDPPQGKVFICAMTARALYLYVRNDAKQLGLIPYHIFENEIEREIDPALYAKYIRPAKEIMGQEKVDNIVEIYQSTRNEMGETP